MKVRSMKQKDHLILEINGNKKLDEKDQAKVNYTSRPSSSEVRALIIKRSGQELEVKEEHEILIEYVGSIDNLETELDGDIKTIKQLLDAKETTMIYAIVEIINDLISIGEFDQGEAEASPQSSD